MNSDPHNLVPAECNSDDIPIEAYESDCAPASSDDQLECLKSSMSEVDDASSASQGKPYDVGAMLLPKAVYHHDALIGEADNSDAIILLCSSPDSVDELARFGIPAIAADVEPWSDLHSLALRQSLVKLENICLYSGDDDWIYATAKNLSETHVIDAPMAFRPTEEPNLSKTYESLNNPANPPHIYDWRSQREKRKAFGINGDDLWDLHFSPQRWVVEGILPEGLSIMYGPPKIGKSFLNLQLSMSIAQGRAALGEIPVDSGDVFYWALEDSQRRVQSRMKALYPDARSRGMSTLMIRTETDDPLFLGGGVEELVEDWARNAKNPRLLLIDTLAKILPERKGREDDYIYYNKVLSPLRRLANEYEFSILLTHHTNKGKDHADPFDSVLGSTALNSVPDASLVLRHGTSGNETATLYGRGRDMDEIDIALNADEDLRWTLLGEAATIAMNETRQAIARVLKAAGEDGIKPAQIASDTGLDPANVRQTLPRMVKAGQAKKIGNGLYGPPI